MMDVCMILLLSVCFFSMKWFVDWCEKQMNISPVKEDEK